MTAKKKLEALFVLTPDMDLDGWEPGLVTRGRAGEQSVAGNSMVAVWVGEDGATYRASVHRFPEGDV
jgi:hypothetical protein